MEPWGASSIMKKEREHASKLHLNIVLLEYIYELFQQELSYWKYASFPFTQSERNTCIRKAKMTSSNSGPKYKQLL